MMKLSLTILATFISFFNLIKTLNSKNKAIQTMVGMLLTFWFLAGQTLETTESVSQRHQAQPHQRQGQQCSGVMKLLVSIKH